MSVTSSNRLSRPIIVVGPGRSGSSVISEYLFAHESIGWLSNYHEWWPTQSWHNRIVNFCSKPSVDLLGEKSQYTKTARLNHLLPKPAEAYAFWDSLMPEGVSFSRGFLHMQKADRDTIGRVRAAFDELLRLQGKQRLGIKITGPARMVFLQSIFPDALFINITRDPVKTISSFMRVPFWQEQGAKELWWKGAYTNAELLRYNAFKDNAFWGTTFQLSKVLQTTVQESKLVSSVMQVSYESFLDDPESLMEEMLSFTELPGSVKVRQKCRRHQRFDGNRQHQSFAREQENIVNELITTRSWFTSLQERWQ